MIEDLKSVSIRPGVSLLTVLPHLNYKPWYALAEFVDNAIQSYESSRAALRKIEGKGWKLAIDIDIDGERGIIVVRDNAAGISREAYGRAFRPAEAPLDASGLSEFGMGMKSASAWLAPRWTIRTSALGEPVERAVSFDIASIVADTIEELSVVSAAAPRDSHFTEVTLYDIRRAPKSRTLGKIKDHLSSLYRSYIARGDVVITLNGERLTFEQPEVLTAPYWRDPSGAARQWRLPVKLALEGGRRAEGWVALRAKGSTTRAGFALLRRGRVIEGSADEPYRPREIFGASNSFVFQRLFGELTLIGFSVSHTKDGIRWDEAEDELLQKLKDALTSGATPMLEQAHNWRSGEPEIVSAEVVPFAPKARFEPSAATPRQPGSARIVTRLAKDSNPHWRHLSMTFGSERWEITITLDDEGGDESWMDVSALPGDGSGMRALEVRLSTQHPFTQGFVIDGGRINEGVVRLAVGLAISEAIAQGDGVRFAGRIRSSLNELMLLGLADQE
ncbi:ATP-binding protein [Sphingomonas bacterium]|uniref:ATP-binding protein n=1 Tax=Sphingomonas bacterium TaxID=1895847 RepID=UPI0015775F1B|nr:ATP-binding protein [Sphingomonas bacterium]